MNGLSLFSSAGIGELHLNRLGIDIKVSNELKLYQKDIRGYHKVSKVFEHFGVF